MSGTKRKNIDRMTPRELKEEVKRLRHQVSRRGYTIGGLYAALRYAIDGNPNVYHVNPNEGVVQGLLNAVEKAEVRRDDIPINELKNISNLPDGFACNICFEDYSMDPEKAHRPVALGCGHVICDGCIKQVRERQNDCPSCRKPIEKILPLYI